MTKRWMLLLGAIGLLVVVAVGLVTAYAVMTKLGPAVAEAESTPPRETALPKGVKLTLKPFTTNLGDSDRPRYITISFELMVRAEKEREEAAMSSIRDEVITVLRSMKAMELNGSAGVERLKQEVQSRINRLMGSDYVLEVKITDILIQF